MCQLSGSIVRSAEDIKKGGKMKEVNVYRALGWGWVSLKELAEIIGQSPKETWENFFGLTKDIRDNLLAWSPDLQEVVQDGTEPQTPELREIPLRRVGLPLHWLGICQCGRDSGRWDPDLGPVLRVTSAPNRTAGKRSPKKKKKERRDKYGK